MFMLLQWCCRSAVCHLSHSSGQGSFCSWLVGDALVTDTPCLTLADVLGKACVISMAIKFAALSVSAGCICLAEVTVVTTPVFVTPTGVLQSLFTFWISGAGCFAPSKVAQWDLSSATKLTNGLLHLLLWVAFLSNCSACVARLDASPLPSCNLVRSCHRPAALHFFLHLVSRCEAGQSVRRRCSIANTLALSLVNGVPMCRAFQWILSSLVSVH